MAFYLTKIEIIIYGALFFSLYFGVLIMLVFLEKKGVMYFNPKKQIFPFVSILAPCYNEEKNIDELLNSLISLDYPKNRLEVIIVNDGSSDTTEQKALFWQTKYPSLIKVFSKANGGKYTALNLGIEKARGEIIGCIDGDCQAEKKSLLRMVNYFQNKETQAVVSTIKITKPRGILLNVQHSEFLVSAFLKKMFSFLGSITVTPGPLSLFRKTTLLKLGPYKEGHLTEDLEMAMRMQSKNLKIEHALDAVVYTKGQTNIKKLCRQRLRWCRGFLLNLNDYKNLLDFRRHGNLALMLAYGFFGAFISVGITGYTFFKIIGYFIQRLNEATLIRFDFSPYLNWGILHLPDLSTKPALFLGILSACLALTFMVLGKKYTCDKLKIAQKAIFFLVIYSFLNAFWWLSAGFSVIFKKRLGWM